jgi:hypothetical protein
LLTHVPSEVALVKARGAGECASKDCVQES